MNKKTGNFFFILTVLTLILTGCAHRGKNSVETIRIDPGIFHSQPPMKAELKETEEEAVYTTRGGETLMNVAFRMYGDYRKWKVLKEANQDIVAGHEKLPAGLELKVPKPITPYTPPKGTRPYLVRDNETLSEISDKLYGTSKFTSMLYELNKSQMKSPDKIFSGFTIFYPPEPGIPQEGGKKKKVKAKKNEDVKTMFVPASN